MFLHLLNEENKSRFIELCEYAALADEVLENKEKETISMYCREMGISEVKLGEKRELGTLLEELSQNADLSEKKIILFEILGLMLSDEKYDEKEEQFVYDIIKKLEIEKQVVLQIRSLLDIYKAVYRELYMTVCL